ncbi:MAG: amidohydrolase family protein [Acidimicrobiales bacterium]
MGRDPSGSGGLSSPDRRKLLVALVFGATNAAALSRLGGTKQAGGRAGQRGTGAASGGLFDDAGSGPADPPALDDATAEPEPGHLYDTVIANGRVIDPETGFDRVAHIGIDGRTITAVSLTPLEGRQPIEATDLVVAPGFIDILSYEPNSYGIWYKVADGVTTNLGMHGINMRAADYFARFANEGSPCHYGGAYDNPFMRGEGGLGLGSGEAASATQIDALVADAHQQLTDGWIGIDLEPEYTPGVEFEELRRLAEVAAERGVTCYVHGRYSDMEQPGTNRDTLKEILDLARETGCAVHVDHITSTGGTFSMDESLSTLTDAIDEEGIDVSACMYPYQFWATYLGSPRFADGWQERYHIGYDDLVIPGTGERLTETSFRQYREDNKLAAAFGIPEDDVRAALRSPLVMIGSDAILEPGNNNHPRSTGCFSRVLGHYVRDREVLGLRAALAKMTVMPARRLESAVPAMRRKGRLQRGADADITVFDPATVEDRSTIDNPAQASVGIEWVVVAGQVVQSPEGQHKDALAGQPITYGAS